MYLFLILFSYLHSLVTHWAPFGQLFWIICQSVHRFSFLSGWLLEICFLPLLASRSLDCWYSLLFCFVISASEGTATSSSLHGLILTGRYLHQSAVLDARQQRLTPQEAHSKGGTRPLSLPCCLSRRNFCFHVFLQSVRAVPSLKCRLSLFFVAVSGDWIWLFMFVCLGFTTGWKGNGLHRGFSEMLEIRSTSFPSLLHEWKALLLHIFQILQSSTSCKESLSPFLCP